MLLRTSCSNEQTALALGALQLEPVNTRLAIAATRRLCGAASHRSRLQIIIVAKKYGVVVQSHQPHTSPSSQIPRCSCPSDCPSKLPCGLPCALSLAAKRNVSHLSHTDWTIPYPFGHVVGLAALDILQPSGELDVAGVGLSFAN